MKKPLPPDGEPSVTEPVQREAIQVEHEQRVAASTKKVIAKHRQLFEKLAQ